MDSLHQFLIDNFRFVEPLELRPRDHIFFGYGIFPIFNTELLSDGSLKVWFYDPCEYTFSLQSRIVREKAQCAIARDGHGAYDWFCTKENCSHRENPMELYHLKTMRERTVACIN